MKNILLTTILMSWAALSQAQNIKGSVVNEKDQPLVGTEVTLLQASDSTPLKYSFVESDGQYLFEGITAGQYIVKTIDYAGNPFYATAFSYNGNDQYTVPTIHTKIIAEALENVTVTYRRPIVQLQADKTVFNIDSTINAVGQNALELMRKSPGVLVDKDENISISGKNGVRVYIDGRPSPLTGSELSEYLKSIQSGSIDAIEIITSPSAKYDAQGNAGIINIRLKKNQNLGTNGSVNLGYEIGVFSRYNGGITLNHRNGKINVFGSYNARYGNNWNEMNFERKLNDTFFQQAVNVVSLNNTHNYKAGIDYFLSDKSILGLVVNGNVRKSQNQQINETKIIHNPTQQIARNLLSQNTMNADRDNINANLNYSYNNTSTGQSLTIDADYGRYNIAQDQIQPNVYSDEHGNYLYENVYNIIAPTTIDISSIKADWEQNFWKGKLSLGAKASFINTQNDYIFKERIAGSFVEDSLRSNLFNYQEKIQAVYGQYTRQFTGIAFQAGLRFENTITTGHSVGLQNDGTTTSPYDSTFDRNYYQFFPSIGFTFNKNPMNQWTLAYSKRIDRPNYQDLNPFEFKMDDYSYRKGNIKLLPQITHNISLSHSYKYMLNTKLEYSHVSDVFAELVDTLGFRLFQTKANLATQDMISLNISFPFQYKNWSSFFNINSYYAMFKADYGNGRVIDLDVFSFNTYGQISYRINDWLSTEVSGWYTAPSIWQGTFRSIAMGGIDIGAQARVLQGKGTIKASVGDVFHTMKWGGHSTFVGQEVSAWGRWESTQLRLNFAYNFGDNKYKTRNRKSGAEEEKGRTNESNGMGQGS